MKHTSRIINSRVRLLVVAAALLVSAATTQAAPVTFNVQVNTSSIAGTAGFLDLQFNPVNASSPSATATVNNFATTGGTLGTAQREGDVTGTLPGTVRFGNSTGFNDLFQGFTFGSSFSFSVTLDSTATAGNFGSEFALSLFGADGTTPLLTTDPGGRLLSIQLRANGTAFVQTFGINPGVITVTQAAAPIPEPATMILLGTGLSGVVAAVRRRRKVV